MYSTGHASVTNVKTVATTRVGGTPSGSKVGDSSTTYIG